jgi:hypothetical protein
VEIRGNWRLAQEARRRRELNEPKSERSREDDLDYSENRARGGRDKWIVDLSLTALLILFTAGLVAAILWLYISHHH